MRDSLDLINGTNRRRFVLGSFSVLALKAQNTAKEFSQYDSLRVVDEQDDPSITLETEHLVAKIIDNTALRARPHRHLRGMPEFSHYFGYHGIRALWRKDEQRNIVAPFFSWLNLQSLQLEGLELDPVDSRAVSGIGRGWPLRMTREGNVVSLRIPRMPRSGVEYQLQLKPGGADALDFEMTFTLHRKTKDKARFRASWPCYMSTFDEVQLYSPEGEPDRPTWRAFGEEEAIVIGEAVNVNKGQRSFLPAAPAAFPAAYGRIGSRVFVLMVDRPEVEFFVVNTGGHLSFCPVQNPAWDFSLTMADYEPGKPFGFRGRMLYKAWTGADEIVDRYRQWKRELAV